MRSILFTVIKRQATVTAIRPCLAFRLTPDYLHPFATVPYSCSVLHKVSNTEKQKCAEFAQGKGNSSAVGCSVGVMDALRFDPKKKTLSLEKLDKPTDPKPDEVIVEVAYAGVCGTDLHIIDGQFPCKASPVTLGHEFSGVASLVGSDVKHIKVGDRVAVDPNSGCWSCSGCTSGDYHLCSGSPKDLPIGINADGGWAKFCRVKASQVFVLPESVTLETGALCEPVSCLSHGWDRLAPIPMGSQILITGAGIIGLLWASTLHLLGYRRIMVCEPVVERRELVAKLGLDIEAVNPLELEDRKKDDPTWGVNVVIDCSGNVKAIEGAFELLLPGGKLLIFGVSPPAAKISISPFKIYKSELTILGVLINPFSFPKAIGFLESLGPKHLEYRKLGIEVFKLSEHEDAIQKIRAGSISKAVFKLD